MTCYSQRFHIVGLYGTLHEVADPYQVVDRRRKGEEPADPLRPAELDLPQ